MRKKLLFANTAVSIIYQIIVVICGFVLPRVILSTFGSEVNGLVNSITQFLFVVSFLELGVGAVVSSNLYGPLSEKNWNRVNIVVSSAEKFFRNIARVLLVYVVILIFVYPFISNSEFDAIYTGSLILIISINSFAQYYIGVIDNIVLGADQRAFIVYGTQAIAHLLNTILCITFIRFGAGIHVVKAVTAIVFLLRPTLVRIYIKRHYPLNRKVKYEGEPLGQKWNAIAQHISECVLDSTDVVILTIFSTLSNVSVYYVYNLVVYNLKNFFLIAASSGVLSVLGELYATNQKEKLRDFFDKTEWIIHTLIMFLFGATAVLIIPFVTVYTDNITDADYIQPLFAFMIVLAHASHCLRLPYFLMVKAAGHYKQTQNCFIVSTIANIVISMILVIQFGLVGVAIGTLVAMIYQTTRLSIYAYKHLLDKKLGTLIKQIIIDVVIFGLIFIVGKIFAMSAVSYLAWIVLAIKVTVCAGLLILIINFVFNRKNLAMGISYLKTKVKKEN